MDAKLAAPAGIDACTAAQMSALQPSLHRIRAIVREKAAHATQANSCRMPALMPGGALLCFAAVKKHIRNIRIYRPVRGDAALLQALAPCRGDKGNLSVPLAEAMPYEPIRHVARQHAKEDMSKAPGRQTK